MENLPVRILLLSYSQAVEIKFSIEFPNYIAVAGSGNGKQKISLDIPITLVPGKNTIDLLSVTVGLAVHSNLQRIVCLSLDTP